MSVTEIDVGQLNEASQALYDLAFARGERQGQEQTLHETTRLRAKALLEVAQTVLANPSTDHEEQTWRVAIARMILGRTPMVVGEVTRALDHLRYGIKQPTREDVATALEFVSQGLAKLERQRIANAVANA